MFRLEGIDLALKSKNLALCGFALLMGLSEAFGFGEQGHRIIAALAAEQLSAPARQQIAVLLANEPEPSLPGISFWADQHKNRYTAPMHYVNMPAGQCHYDAARDCPDGRCVVQAIKRYRVKLAEPYTKEDERRTALKMLVHLVGDAHQPLHSGLAEDRGGNLFQLQWAGKGSNLHRLWDSQLIEAVDPDWASYAQSLGTRSANNLDSDDPTRWAEESCKLVSSSGFYPSNHKPGLEYLTRWQFTLDSQMDAAGRRLASMLNAAFSDR